MENFKQKISNVKCSDRLSLSFNNSDYPGEPIYISFRRADQLNADVILNRIEAVLQSNANFIYDSNLITNISHIPMPNGNGRKKKIQGIDTATFFKSKRSLISYQDMNDTFCLAYALILAKAFCDGHNSLLKQLQNHPNLLKEKGLNLCHAALVDLSNGGGPDEIKQFQNYFKNQYRIVVYNGRSGESILYENTIQNNLPKLNILFENNHYVPIKSLTAAFNVSYYCDEIECHKGYASIYKHKCKFVCQSCFIKPPCDLKNISKNCLACSRNFKGEQCFKNHVTRKICENYKKCPTCYTVYVKQKKPHICHTRYCETCQEYLKISHQCYMQNYSSRRKDDESFLYVFFDLECTQDQKLGDYTDRFVHIANLCITQQICSDCITDENIINACSSCGVREHVFYGNECISMFFAHYFNPSIQKKFQSIVFIAHNMSGYDGHFILRHIYSNSGIDTPKIIMNGTKIISIQISRRIKIIDSLSYFQCALANLPKMFQLPIYKGFYPHLFNVHQFFNYVGSIPDAKYFCPDSMSSSSREIFFEWYNDQINSNVVFDNKKELIKYCRLDVEILRKACIKFANNFWQQNKIDPFMDANTIAGACNKVFRSNYLKPNTIGIIPQNGYRFVDNQSYIGLKWLVWQELTNGITIQHAARGFEVKLEHGLKVDGYHHESKTVYEFFGCYFHGCEKCYSGIALTINKSKYDIPLILSRRESTKYKIEKLHHLGYTVVFTYECDFKLELLANPSIDQELSNSPLITCKPLNPRDAFYGGRTNASKLYHKVTDKQKIHYFDIYSLYPYINKYFKYPIGHPKVIVGDDCKKIDLMTFDGIISCQVIAPRQLLYPVLPTHMHGKLMFFLCQKCALTLSNEKCSHSDKDRSFKGTWVIDEVHEAIKQGYRVINIYEMWQYKILQYNKELGIDGLFAPYINKFLKLKAEASGWPLWCADDVLSKLLYIESFELREGVTLDENNVQLNPGLRSNAKLCLNSFWGKFGQRENMTQTVIINSYEELVNKLVDDDIEIQSYIIINENSLLLSFVYITEAVKPLSTTNVAIAAYTTTGARLELYKYLNLLGERILYYDTDSIIFTQDENEINPITEDYLGAMTNELECYGANSYITEFVSGGPKNYAFKVLSPNTNETHYVCKVKGISLNYENSKLINFDKIKEIIFNNSDSDIQVKENKILRTKDNSVFSTKRKKNYNVCYTKRMRIEKFDTLPFGYC